MNWYDYVAWFFGGLFLVNAIPHVVAGVMGRAFQSPFAHPPGQGLSSSTVNVAWGAFNCVVAYVLLWHVGAFSLANVAHAATVGVAAVAGGFFLASRFGRFHGGNLKGVD